MHVNDGCGGAWAWRVRGCMGTASVGVHGHVNVECGLSQLKSHVRDFVVTEPFKPHKSPRPGCGYGTCIRCNLHRHPHTDTEAHIYYNCVRSACPCFKTLMVLGANFIFIYCLIRIHRGEGRGFPPDPMDPKATKILEE